MSDTIIKKKTISLISEICGYYECRVEVTTPLNKLKEYIK